MAKQIKPIILTANNNSTKAQILRIELKTKVFLRPSLSDTRPEGSSKIIATIVWTENIRATLDKLNKWVCRYRAKYGIKNVVP